MKQSNKQAKPQLRCAIYTRKSSDEGLEQSFNSLHAQREACEAYVKSQQHEGWRLVSTPYDDGGYSGGNMERPALARLIDDIKTGNVDIIVVYKVDRLSRSLADFVRIIDLLDRHNVSFVSVTQQFNTSTSMGRLTLNVLLSFAQFEREVTGERIRDKIAASKQKGLWMGGMVTLGYDLQDRLLVVNEAEAKTVRHIYERYLVLGGVRELKTELDNDGYLSKSRNIEGKLSGGKPFSRGALYSLLKNPIYIGKIAHQGKLYDGQHAAIVEPALWQRVQEQLSANRRKKALRTRAKEPSLLTGLLFDDTGNPMSPTHATKKSRRYRYYISQAVLQYREQQAGSVIRIAAHTVEDLVTHQLKRLLGTPSRIVDVLVLRGSPAIAYQKMINAAAILASEWDGQPPPDQIETLKRLISKIVIGRQKLEITFSRSGLATTLLPSRRDPLPGSHIITVPVQLKRCGFETRLVVPNGETPDLSQASAEAIQKALAKGLAWNQLRVTGSGPSMARIARENGVTQRYIAQLVKLAFLSPDIISAMIRGEIPAELSLSHLKKGFPLDWEQQRKTLGFPPLNS